MDESEVVSGGCFCGKVRYAAKAFLKRASYCHCSYCRRTSGAPAEVAVELEAGTLRWSEGEPKYHRTSPFGERGFCPDCGSRLIWRLADGSGDEYANVSVGSLDRPEQVEPSFHQCVESQLPWYRIDDALPRLTTEDLPQLVALRRAAGLD
jgi:hypothetical protein